jgi:colanic acid biosynthesis glycosyl transferase WcaI
MSAPRKKVLVISSNFSPEASGIAVYSSDLVFDILNPNYDVIVITGLPHYPWWKIPEEFSHIVPGRTEIDGIELIRINHAIPSKSGATGRAQLEFSIWLNGRKVIRDLENHNFNLVIAIMPTVASGLLARLILSLIHI